MTTLQDVFLQFKDREKTAFIYRTGVRRFVYSYKDVDRLSRQMAAWLEKQGVSKGDRVVVWAPNSPQWAIVFWAIMLRGAILVPVDFVSPKERVEKITDLTEASLIIQSQNKFDKFSNESTPSVFIEDIESLILGELENINNEKVDPSDIAEIIYTSGTTGNPKGVQLSHKNLTANLLQISKHIKINPDFSFLSLLPLSHMFEQTGGFLYPLLNGGTIIYLRTIKPSEIMEAFKEERVYVTILVPRLLKLLKTSVERELDEKHILGLGNALLNMCRNLPQSFKKTIFYPVHRKFGTSLKFFVSGGAALDKETALFWQNLGFTVIEGYGLSECSPSLTLNTLDKQVIGSVGVPIPGVEIKIEDGEILAKGDNIFSGYYNNEIATKNALDDNGWFHTGDLGYFDENHNLIIKGRAKDLIVTSEGINIHPEDIEAILHQIEGVKEAAVLGINSGNGEEVHAAVILKEQSGDVEQIIRTANSRLDSLHQVTRYSLWSDADFPKTATLKVQKFKVKQAIEGKEQESKDEISEDTLINLIAKITAKKTGDIQEDSILVQDLGLTSIGRLELVNYIESEYRMDLDDSLINHRTKVSDLRKLIQNRGKYKSQNNIQFWPNALWARLVRKVTDPLITRQIFKYYVDLKVEGLENLSGIKQPVLFIANHLSYGDHPCIYFGLPQSWRSKLATAAWEEFFFPAEATIPTKIIRRIFFYLSSLMINLFPLSQSKGFRSSLNYMGKMIDRKINVLVFPEGERSRTTDMLPFQPGIGLMVKELKVPVIPIKLEGIEKILHRDMTTPIKGKATVRFGKPLLFKNETSDEIVRICQKTIEEL